MRAHLREPVASPSSWPGISILKPLCGVDDGLAANLDAFARLRYPDYELLLGVRDLSDPAFPVALACATAYPDRVRLVVQRGAPGFNPKVNQLITLQAYARHSLLVVSDSNVRVSPRYLREIAALLEDPEVGCVTHPVGGSGHQTVGSTLDNLHFAAGVGPGIIAAKRIARRPLVLGKSMALRKADLSALGGFGAFKDVLAEDYAFAQQVRRVLRKRVVLGREPVLNISHRRTCRDFLRRYLRWAVIHRTAVRPWTYLAEGLLHPAPLAVLAYGCSPTPRAGLIAGAVVVAKALLDVHSARALAPGHFRWATALAVPLKDALLFAAWIHGLSSRTVVWRGTRLRVAAGSRLVPLPQRSKAAPATYGSRAWGYELSGKHPPA